MRKEDPKMTMLVEKEQPALTTTSQKIRPQDAEVHRHSVCLKRSKRRLREAEI